MPGDAPAEPDAEPAPEPPKPVVLGTAIGGAGGNFATVQLGSGRPTSVRVGDKVGIYTVTRIERGKVLFTSQSGERLEVSAAKQGS